MEAFVCESKMRELLYFVGEVHGLTSRQHFGFDNVEELSPGILKTIMSDDRPGINRSDVYCGKKDSSAPLHVVDAWLYSKNIVCAG